MRLTKDHKKAFVKAVMDDVPSIDYVEKVRELILADSIAQLPKGLQVFAKDPKTADLINSGWKTIERPRDKDNRWVGSVGCTIKGNSDNYAPSKKAQALLAEWLPKLTEQTDIRNKLERQLSTTIESCNTLKQAQEAFPELVKYLPSVAEKSLNLPAPVYKNVLLELAKAGFPKGKKAVAYAQA